MEGRSHSNEPLYAKARQFSQYDENRYQSPNNYRAAINSIMEQLKTKTNLHQLKQLARVIDRWSQHKAPTTTTTTSQLDRLYHLRLQDVQKLLLHLDTCFLTILQQLPDRRLESLYSQYRHILHRISKLEATSMHANSTKMKKHLLDEIRDEQEKRVKVEKERNAIMEGTQEALQQKERVIRDLRAVNAAAEELAGQKERVIRELRAENARLGRELKELSDDLRDIKLEADHLQDFKAQDEAITEIKNENESLYARINLMNKDLAEKDQSLADCIKTIETLKWSLSQARTQLAEKPQIDYVIECASCKRNHSKSDQSQQLLSPSPSHLSQASRPSPKIPPAPPKTKGSSSQDIVQQQRYNQLLRLLFIQAISLQDFIAPK